jgi:hypothetical protein
VLDQDDVLHVAGFGFNGFRGLSPLRHALRMTGAVSLATQEYAARFFANSARPDVVLETDQKLGPDVVDKLREQWSDRHQGPMNAHKPAVLTNGLSAKVLSLPMEDLQLLEIAPVPDRGNRPDLRHPAVHDRPQREDHQLGLRASRRWASASSATPCASTSTSSRTS